MLSKSMCLDALEETKIKPGIIEPVMLIKPLVKLKSMLNIKDNNIELSDNLSSVSNTQQYAAKNLLRYIENNRVQNAFYELYDFIRAGNDELTTKEEKILWYLTDIILISVQSK